MALQVHHRPQTGQKWRDRGKRLILTYFFIPITSHALPNSFSLIDSFIHSLIHSFIYSFIHSFIKNVHSQIPNQARRTFWPPLGLVFSRGHTTLHLGRSVRWSVTFLNCNWVSHYCSCQIVRDCIAVYPALFWKQGQIRGDPVADGRVGAVMQKLLTILKVFWTNLRTNLPTN